MSANRTKKPSLFDNLLRPNKGTAGTGVSRQRNDRVGDVVQTTLRVDAVITMTDATTAGNHGSRKIFDFPEGFVNVLGAVTDLHAVAAAGIDADAALVMAIGSAAVSTDNATLTSTEADIVPSTVATLTTSEGDMNAGSSAAKILDGSGTPAALYLNAAVPDADSTGNSTLTVTGTVTVTWVNLGDKG